MSFFKLALLGTIDYLQTYSYKEYQRNHLYLYVRLDVEEPRRAFQRES